MVKIDTIRCAASRANQLWPGLLVCGMIALAAHFLSDHYRAPAMLMALLLGLVLHYGGRKRTIDAAAGRFQRLSKRPVQRLNENFEVERGVFGRVHR